MRWGILPWLRSPISSVFMLFLFEISTGFALYSQSHPRFLHDHPGRMDALASCMCRPSGSGTTLSCIFFSAFTLIHVYIGWYLDSAEKNGAMGSIFGGYKFVTGKEWE